MDQSLPRYFFRDPNEAAPTKTITRLPQPVPADPAGPVAYWPKCPIIMLDASPDGTTQGLWFLGSEDATTCTYTYIGDYSG